MKTLYWILGILAVAAVIYFVFFHKQMKADAAKDPAAVPMQEPANTATTSASANTASARPGNKN